MSTRNNFVSFLGSLAVVAFLLGVVILPGVPPASGQMDSSIIRAEQIIGGTLREAVQVPAASLPSDVLTTGEVHAGTNVTITEDETGLTVNATGGGAVINDTLTTEVNVFSAAKTALEDSLRLPLHAKADDSDKLDNIDSAGFSLSGHNHDLLYLALHGKADDSEKLDNIDSTGFALAAHNHSGVYLPLAAKAADSELLDGIDSTGFSLSSHNHSGVYLAIGGKAADSDLLDGYNLEVVNTATAANAYFYYDGSTSSIKRKALADVIAEVGGGGGADLSAFKNTTTIRWTSSETEAYPTLVENYVPRAGGEVGTLSTPRVTLADNGSGLADAYVTYTNEESAGSWTTPATPYSVATKKFAVGAGGVWIMGSSSASQPALARSTNNGVTWTSLGDVLGGTGYVYDVAYAGNSVFVACGNTSDGQTDKVWRSVDNGATWVEAFSVAATFGSILCIASDGAGKIVAPVYNVANSPMLTSTDYGATWTYPYLGVARSFRAVACNGAGAWVALADGTGGYRSADNAATWVATTLPVSGTWYGLSGSSSGTFIACRNAQTGAYRSVNGGSTWSTITVGGSPAYTGSGFPATDGSGRWRLAGGISGGGYVFISTDDGLTWANEQAMGSSTPSDLVTNGTVWVAATISTSGTFYRYAATITQYVRLVGSGGVIMPNIPSASATALHINTTTGKLSYSASSARFKTDIKPMPCDWERVLALQPVTYTEISTGEKNKLGFIAEQVAPIYPSEVTRDREGRPFSVNYEHLLGPAFAAIQELKRENDELRTRVRRLERRR